MPLIDIERLSNIANRVTTMTTKTFFLPYKFALLTVVIALLIRNTSRLLKNDKKHCGCCWHNDQHLTGSLAATAYLRVRNKSCNTDSSPCTGRYNAKTPSTNIKSVAILKRNALSEVLWFVYKANIFMITRTSPHGIIYHIRYQLVW